MKNKKKGFTLVELIVVLAILAILAAMLVPALTGYIDKANEKKVIATARQYYIAAQTVVSDAYASNDEIGTISAASGTVTVAAKSGKTIKEERLAAYKKDYERLSEYNAGDSFTFTVGTDSQEIVSGNVQTSSGKATLSDGSWIVTKS